MTGTSETTCQRLRTYPVSDTRSTAGTKCGRSVAGLDAEGTPSCARHLGADKAAATRREQARIDWHRRMRPGA